LIEAISCCYPHPSPLPKGEGVISVVILSHSGRGGNKRRDPLSLWERVRVRVRDTSDIA